MPNDHAETRNARRASTKGSTLLEAFRDAAGTGPNIAIRVLDLSATGAKLLLSERLPPGHILGVAIYGPGRLPIAGVAEVKWSEEDRVKGRWLAGVAFQRQAGADHVAELARP